VEDTDGDGVADRSWAFVQEPFLRAPMGVAVIGNKVVVSMAPDLIVYTDVDGDAVFNPAKGDTREVLLTGFNGRNHDHSLHSVTVGPDGKWYFSVGNCGAVFTDRDGRTWRIGAGSQTSSWWPKDPAFPDRDPKEFGGQPSDDGRVYVGGFIARMNPDATGVEILAHNLRNSYENCITSFGDIFAADNDDQPACRTFAVLEGGNYGFASRDGGRSWQADRRPGQDIRTATWRQQDPGVAPAGDIYGGGAPTGIVFYENGALGPAHDGTLLVCESARNTIFGYKPVMEGAGWKLERFDFLTTNAEGKVSGTDYTGGDQSARADDTKSHFRPSDIAVGPDGALYIADWLDPRIGGHNDLDTSLSGTIYRVAPKGFKPVVPAVDLTTVDGALQAITSPAVHVRALGAERLRHARLSDEPIPAAPAGALTNHISARRAWIDLDDGLVPTHRDRPNTEAGKATYASMMMRLPHAKERELRHRSRWTGHPDWVAHALDFARDLPAGDADALEAFGLASDGRESEVYDLLLPALGDPDPLRWSEKFAALAWRLHPPQSVDAFKSRALADSLNELARRDALTAIAFNQTAEAAAAMLEVAEATRPGPAAAADSTASVDTPGDSSFLHATALWWLLNNKDTIWKSHGVAAALKARGVYDPDTVTLTAISLPPAPPATFGVEDVLKLTGVAARGEVASQRCLICHRIGGAGVDYGPEMTGWGKTQPSEVVARALIDPSADIAHGFHGTRLETNDGLVIEGLLINDADPLIIQSMGGLTQAIPRHRIKSKSPMPHSLMMTATALGLSAKDVADLIAFLKQ